MRFRRGCSEYNLRSIMNFRPSEEGVPVRRAGEASPIIVVGCNYPTEGEMYRDIRIALHTNSIVY